MSQQISNDDFDRFSEELGKFGHTFRHLTNIKVWLSRTYRLSLKITLNSYSSEDEWWDVAGPYSVQLYGVLNDLYFRFYVPTGEEPIFSEVRRKFSDALHAIRGEFTDDELLWLEFVRNRSSHPFLLGYLPKLKSGSNWNHFPTKILTGSRQQFALADLIPRAQKASDDLGGDKQALFEFAKRTHQRIKAAELAFEPIYIGALAAS